MEVENLTEAMEYGRAKRWIVYAPLSPGDDEQPGYNEGGILRRINTELPTYGIGGSGHSWEGNQSRMRRRF